MLRLEPRQPRGELEEDDIRVINVMPGAIATNFARNFDPEFLGPITIRYGLRRSINMVAKLVY